MRTAKLSARICGLCLLLIAGAAAAGAIPGQQSAEPDQSLKACQTAVATQSESAIEVCTSVIDSKKYTGTSLADAYMSRGSAFRAKKEYKKAADDFHSVLTLVPKAAMAHYALAQLAIDQSKTTEAIAHYNDALRMNPTLVPALTDRGSAYLANGDPDRALQDFSQAIKLRPDFIPAYMNRAQVYMRRSDFESAIRDYDKTLQLNSSYLPGIVARANARAAAKQYDEAISDFDDAIRLNTGDASLWERQADLYSEKGDFPHAIRDLNTALKLRPGDAALLSERGYLEAYLRDYDSAARDLAASLAAKKDNAYAALWLYLVQQKSGKPGAEDLQKNIEGIKMAVWPGPVLKFYLGSLDAEGVLAAAKDADALKAMAQRCEADFYLGEDALLRGKVEEARKLFQRCIATGLSAYVEYRGAVVELNKLQAPH
jgi:lipoprotein NlpI